MTRHALEAVDRNRWEGAVTKVLEEQADIVNMTGNMQDRMDKGYTLEWYVSKRR